MDATPSRGNRTCKVRSPRAPAPRARSLPRSRPCKDSGLAWLRPGGPGEAAWLPGFAEEAAAPRSYQCLNLACVLSFQGNRQRQIIYRVTSQQDSSVLQVISGPETSAQEEISMDAMHVFIDGHGEPSERSASPP